jgi:beta-alanine degradation protein BauB
MRKRLLVLLGFPLFALSSASSFRQDPVKVSPNNYTVLLENERVRVLKGCLKPGEKIPMHSHPARVIYELTDQTSRFTFPATPPVESRSTAGEVKWGTPVIHSEANIGKTEGCALIVELKQ